jgi:hypothetical protein
VFSGLYITSFCGLKTWGRIRFSAGLWMADRSDLTALDLDKPGDWRGVGVNDPSFGWELVTKGCETDDVDTVSGNPAVFTMLCGRPCEGGGPRGGGGKCIVMRWDAHCDWDPAPGLAEAGVSAALADAALLAPGGNGALPGPSCEGETP